MKNSYTFGLKVHLAYKARFYGLVFLKQNVNIEIITFLSMKYHGDQYPCIGSENRNIDVFKTGKISQIFFRQRKCKANGAPSHE